MTTIGFLHTAQVHVATFDGLVAEFAPQVDVVSVVATELLSHAIAASPEDFEVLDGIAARLEQLDRAGADFIVCTCSTIGGVAESVGADRGQPVVRIDRAMAERAVATGERIAVVAAVDSTLAPTLDLIEAVASEAEVAPVVSACSVPGAWELFEAGRTDAYLDAIEAALPGLATDHDVIVLAQASMAAVADRAVCDVPVLASPRLGVADAVGRVLSGFASQPRSDR